MLGVRMWGKGPHGTRMSHPSKPKAGARVNNPCQLDLGFPRSCVLRDSSPWVFHISASLMGRGTALRLSFFLGYLFKDGHMVNSLGRQRVYHAGTETDLFAV